MNIAVVLRLMPSLGDELEVDDNRLDIDRETVEMVINECDEQALPVAYARGADKVVLVDAGECNPYDTRRASLAFAHAVRELGPDLVLTGVQTLYDVFGQTAPYLAAELGWPQANVVVGTTVADRTARVMQEYAGGRLAVLALTLPAVVGVQSASSPPRYVSMARLRQAMSEASAETISAAIDAPAAAPTITALARPERTGGATMLEGDPEEVTEQVAALLRERN